MVVRATELGSERNFEAGGARGLCGGQRAVWGAEGVQPDLPIS